MSSAAYVVHSVSRLGVEVARLVAAGGLLVVLIVVFGHHLWWGAVLVGFLVLVSRASLRAGWSSLRVEADGISLSFPTRATRGGIGGTERRFVAWPVVHRIEVDPARDVVRVVLRSDAPLPPWLRGRVVDPADPDIGPVLERAVPGLDPAALQQAVLALSPTTPVVTASRAA